VSPSDTLSQISFLLGEVTRLARVRFDAEVAADGLSGASWRVVGLLVREDGQTQAALARTLLISRVAVGEMIDRLSRDGWVERRADSADRRTWRIFLTPFALERVPTLRRRAQDFQARCFAGVPDADIAHLKTTLETLHGRLNAMADATTSDTEEDTP
jgi:DNA-binding MarR family transcriptional regulator